VDFEYDRKKSQANKAKHGIDFEEAQALWNDPIRLEAPIEYVAEPRFSLTAKWNSKVWFAIYTIRKSKIRIISVRRARDDEHNAYEPKNDHG
jgi:uncharacterized DUF497 family protein